MSAEFPYQLLADAVLLLHFGIVLFVVGGLIVVLLGNLRSWRWVNAWWFRGAHMLAIGVVVAESWLDITCPLTTLEAWLRTQAGAVEYQGGFIEHWVQRLLFWHAPPWVFTLAYSLFGLLVVITWWRFPPELGRRARAGRSPKPASADADAGTTAWR